MELPQNVFDGFVLWIIIPSVQRSCWGGGYTGFAPSVRPSRMPCPLCIIYSYGWILSILGTNDHYHERVCCAPWPLTLTHIFKVIRPWLRKSCPLCSVYSSGWILSICGTKITIIRRCVACYVFFQNLEIKNFGKFFKLFGLDLEKKSTILDGFFPYLAQMITSMRRCVAWGDLWPWPISSRSFGLDLENRVLSVASTVLDGFFPYLVQMITSMRRCVACDDLWPWPISSRSFDLDYENHVRSVTFSVLDRLFFWLGIQYDSIVWVIMRRRGVSSERRRSSCSSCVWRAIAIFKLRLFNILSVSD